ncbi:tRNA methyltransferase complex GCD14 subunit-domain-containing protein [Cerioporus squamosus]|nr:tRNA methyltransferase complex GCD14 subunit-domain-containing protein [Cerioporus squamosus]
MWSTAREVAAGDVVIAWMTRDIIQPLVVTPGKELNSKYGYYRHEDLVGVPYGSKVRSRNGKGFFHLLRPTPELWTLALPHRTQILYLADIAFVVSWLDLKPGSKVIEAGTGSGSFSHSVARTVGPTGHLWSYEFHEARASKAKEEFTRHGMDDIVTLTHRNVCKDGFTVTDTVDAVFLDLPAPWDAIGHAKNALRKDRSTRICCFSPCMEQVLRTVSALNEAGFTEITMYETLLRPHQVESTPPLTPISIVSDRLKQSEARREEKRLRQIANARAGAERRAKRKAEEEAAKEKEGKRIKSDGEADTESIPPEVQAQDERAATEGMAIDGPAASTASPVPDTSSTPVEDAPPTLVEEATPAAGASEPQKITLSKTFAEVRGHTSYLTFAVLLPARVREVAAASTSVTVSAESTPPPPPAAEASPVNVLIVQAATHVTSTQKSKTTDAQSGV